MLLHLIFIGIPYLFMSILTADTRVASTQCSDLSKGIAISAEEYNKSLHRIRELLIVWTHYSSIRRSCLKRRHIILWKCRHWYIENVLNDIACFIRIMISYLKLTLLRSDSRLFVIDQFSWSVNETNQVNWASTTEATAEGEHLQAECNLMEH
jgi:hypothetical protein